MDWESISLFVMIGLGAGWLAGQIVQGHEFGLVGDLIVGLCGAVLGGVLYQAMGMVAYGWYGSLISATAGAVILLFLIGIVRNNHPRL